jgi:hypothetical protein
MNKFGAEVDGYTIRNEIGKTLTRKQAEIIGKRGIVSREGVGDSRGLDGRRKADAELGGE